MQFQKIPRTKIGKALICRRDCIHYESSLLKNTSVNTLILLQDKPFDLQCYPVKAQQQFIRRRIRDARVKSTKRSYTDNSDSDTVMMMIDAEKSHHESTLTAEGLERAIGEHFDCVMADI
ncbi:hypothetical protein CEXT_241011 [Caerostris extrusa]|uniref:Uncharacterized protein n=1 Tax=Caerostris extrusa TaxID=172846 RepID=A0AAV4PWT8_CAEEX|nr:hypothetical protein CEXT_241011 [Caerostris extrusa]